MSRGWIGVDLDGTLAQYDGFKGAEVIGEPIPLMAGRVRRWLAEGRDVRILTARVWKPPLPNDIMMMANDAPVLLQYQQAIAEAKIAEIAIRQWCRDQFGQELPVTCQKDYHMYELWDDRAIQVIPNTGLRADGKTGDE